MYNNNVCDKALIKSSRNKVSVSKADVTVKVACNDIVLLPNGWRQKLETSSESSILPLSITSIRCKLV